MEKDLAIITSGGAFLCGYGGGAMLALAEKFKIKTPSVLISASGSSGNGSYFITGQYDSIRNAWEKDLSSKEILDFKRIPNVLDVDYIIDNLLRKKSPINEEKIYTSPTNYFIPAMNRKTGRIEYFWNKDGKTDFFEAMRATMAVPFFYRLSPHVEINGSTYCDSRLSSSSKTHIKKAVDSGSEKILLINNYPKKEASGLERYIENYLADFWLKIQDKEFKKNYYEEEKTLLNYNPPKKTKVFTLEPRENQKHDRLNNDPILLAESFQKGYIECSSNEDLKRFLED